MGQLKKLTLLHSNDLHGDFTAEQVDSRLLGGVSLLSGYVQQTRQQEECVLYAISGDMFRGSLIDSEFKGVSTIEIMNMLTPDVATLGNHEIDYGLGHLLFLEKCARFPIINANLYIKSNHARLFRSHILQQIGGMKILFIGILTQEVLAKVKSEALIGSLVDVHEAAAEVGKICDSYRTEDVDLTVLLTHIGLESDKELAALLNPAWGVDLIIGGHSHSLLQTPCIVSGIPIVQAASGTDQIGRFDLVVDTQRNALHSYTWQLVPIDSSHCPRDMALEQVLHRYQTATDAKYNRYITRFSRCYTHPRRDRESQLGRLFADILKDTLGLDVMLFGSGSLRRERMGPIVTYRDLIEMFPYDETILRLTLTGAQLKQALAHIFRPECLLPDAHGESYQFSSGLQVVVDLAQKAITALTYQGQPIEDDRLFAVGLQNYHYENLEAFFSLNPAEVSTHQPPRIVAASSIGVIEEWLCRQELVTAPDDRRWITRDADH